jgi:hypothetical protein
MVRGCPPGMGHSFGNTLRPIDSPRNARRPLPALDKRTWPGLHKYGIDLDGVCRRFSFADVPSLPFLELLSLGAPASGEAVAFR